MSWTLPLTPSTAMTSTWIKHPKVRPETIQLSEIIDVNLHDLGLDPNCKNNKRKHNLGIIKIKKKFASEDNSKKAKDNPQSDRNVFVSYLSDKGLILEYIKNFYNSIMKKKTHPNNPFKNGQRL